MLDQCKECDKDLIKVSSWVVYFNYEKYIKHPYCEDCFNNICKFT